LDSLAPIITERGREFSITLSLYLSRLASIQIGLPEALHLTPEDSMDDLSRSPATHTAGVLNRSDIRIDGQTCRGFESSQFGFEGIHFRMKGSKLGIALGLALGSTRARSRMVMGPYGSR
jgi:hypothetical protein